MIVSAINIRFLEGVKIELTFQDGKVITYDMALLENKYPKIKELELNRDLFLSGHLDGGGYGVIWDDDIDIDAMTVYEDGELVGYVSTTLNQKIGLLLAKTRDEKGITQVQLSKLSHIDQGDISKLEKGIGNPTLAKINKLFNALGKTIDVI